MVRAAWRLFLAAVLALSLAANVLSFTSAAFVGFVSAAASVAGYATVQARQAARRSRVTRRIALRTARGAARSVAALAPQSLPWIGAASIAGVTAWELADACATLQDLAELDPDADARQTRRICGLAAPALGAQFGLTRPAQPASPDEPDGGSEDDRAD